MYCTIAHIVNKIGEKALAKLSNPDDQNGVVNETYIDELIAKKTDYINTYLRGRYTLPLDGEHPLLEEICVDLVRLTLYESRSGSKKAEELTAIRTSVETTLDKLQRGSILLDVSMSASHPVFFRTNLRTAVFTNTVLEQFT